MFKTEFKDDDEIDDLSQALEQSKIQIISLKQSLSQSQKSNTDTKIKYIEKEIMDLSKDEMKLPR